MTDLPTLAAYLRARLDEEEAAARARLAELPSPWLVERDRRNGGWQVVTPEGWIVAREDDGGLSEEHARWIAATADPGRALAEITAKRAVVRHHSAEYAPLVADTHCPACGDMMPCPTLRYLAQPHASRPDFDPAWRLEATRGRTMTDPPERYRGPLAKLERRAFDETIQGGGDPLVPSTACAAPGQRHPWYAGKRWIVEWLNHHGPYAERDHIPVPVLPVVTADYYDPEAPLLDVSLPGEVLLTRRKAVAPCPYVGEPVAYMWHVGADDLGRQVAGDSWLAPEPPDMRWGGPFEIG